VDNETNHASASSTCIALFKQVYYTVSVDPPEDPAAMFDGKVTLDQVQRVVNAQNPAAYVKSMDYGRIILVRMETSDSVTEADLAAAMRYATAGPAQASVKSDLKTRYEQIINNSTFTVLALGGNATDATKLMDDPKKVQDSLFKLIKSSSQFNKQNPAYPIAYTVNFLKDNSLATFNFSTDYTEFDCKEYPAGFVRVKNSGAYVARFKVTWDETGPDGRTKVPKTWSSGNVTAGYHFTVDLPGDAKKIKILGEENTGFSWREAKSWSETGPTNKCYRIYGTTLMPKGDNDCD
jgi:thiol-activated cytolysin